MHRQITGRLTGRVTKWVVAAAWIIVFVVASGFAAKLTDVQNNEASSWLPASAESTKVLDELSTAVDPNDIPTLVVYDRSSGLTEDDLAAMDEQAAEIAKIDGVTSAGVISPNVAQQQGLPVQLLSEDGEVGYLYFVFNFGENGWTDIPAAADEVRDIAQVDGVNVHLAGYGGQAADSAEAFEGIDTNLILITLLVVIVILLLTYRSPILWLPAMLVICGRWVFWPKRPTFGSPEPTSTGFWARVGNRIAPNPRKVWLITAGLLAIACLGLFRLDPSGLSTEDTYTKEFDSIKGQQVLTEHGLADSSNTVQVVANTDALPEVQDALAGIDGLGEPRPTQDLGSGRSYFEATINADISSPAAFAIVESSRDAVHQIDGADALVGGGAAFYLDTKVASNRDSKVIIPIVLIVVFLILMGLLRAVAAPLILIGTVILSFGAALGISALLFEFVFGFAGSDPGFPLFVFVFLVALGIDYNIFLMTRVREETQTFGTRRGSLIALSSTGGVITSAGLVLAATFLVLGSIPVVFLAEIGVAVALGVMLDTLIVRSVLVTAINLDLGGKIWWPSKLDRGDAAVEAPPAPLEEDALARWRHDPRPLRRSPALSLWGTRVCPA